MASPKNGQITFYFDTLPELEDQMREALGLPTLAEVARGKKESAIRMLRQVYPEPVKPPEATEVVAPPMAGKTASGITEDVRKANQEAAAAKLAADKAAIELVKEAVKAVAETAAPVPEQAKVEQAAPQPPPPAAQDAPAITLETLGNAPYPELLAFCDAHPEVGVNTATCQAAYFRKLVEMKIKTYLETSK